MDLSVLFNLIKATKDLAKDLSKIGDSEVKSLASQLLSIILDLQGRIFEFRLSYEELATENKKLYKKIEEMTNWEKIERQYELKEFAPGVLAFRFKQEIEPSKPDHWLCPNCYLEQKASILQRAKIDHLGTHYICLRCDKKLIDPTNRANLTVYSTSPPRRGF